MPAVTGTDNGVGYGVSGSSTAPHVGKGVEGTSTGGDGVFGQTGGAHAAAVRGVHTGHISAIAVIGELGVGITAVKGQAGGGSGVAGAEVEGSGVWGDAANGAGVVGTSPVAEGVIGEGSSFGVRGLAGGGGGGWGGGGGGGVVSGLSHSTSAGVKGANDDPAPFVDDKGGRVTGAAAGVFGISTNGDGVHGEANGQFGAGVMGLALNPDATGPGVWGQSQRSEGVLGSSPEGTGVWGVHGDPALQESLVVNDAARAGVFGASENGAGVLGYSRGRELPAVYAYGGLKAIALGKPLAGQFVGDVELGGNVQVDGDIRLPGADCAEQFAVADATELEAGTVVVIDGDGSLRQSEAAYDHKVAGVVSGAGQYRPAIVLDTGDSESDHRVPVALVGKVYCKVDARHSPIDVGDLLTTSPTPGHAMRAADPLKAFGAIIGKALGAQRDGNGLIPILVALG